MKSVSVFSLFFSLVLINFAAGAQEFSVDEDSPGVAPGRAADIIASDGRSIALEARQLVSQPAFEIDAFSYGVDQVEPLGLGYHVFLHYSVDRQTVGLQGDPRPGGGAVWNQARPEANGAAGDIFLLRVILAPPPIGMFPIARGLSKDAPSIDLIPLPPEPQSNIDGLSVFQGSLDRPVYVSVPPGGAVGRNWGPGDIIEIIPSDTAPQAQIWATSARLGLTPEDDIDGLAISNGGSPGLDAGDIVYVSLTRASPTRVAITQGAESVFQVAPGPIQVVYDNTILNILPDDELDAMTAWDPGYELELDLQPRKTQ